ncbi:hypothetical protein; putative exported protein [Cupriavidus taiwanensis]|uniref:hypothetical protein n=1 Tax=Cupriavidus taiwanensis TaxID=164546 RepID=UPI000E11D221|nr:hypothetical protein [Cupriavidus taiwanensis]SOY97631.1 hypothetical protein; putative exported protein [Cupriavidus taiwanensis]SOZ00291.1 hypothetical protein; putative exported protein [Cupriavidus taiwanensis]
MHLNLIACALAVCAGITQAATTELPPAVAQASRHAMAACQEYMHDDADEYRSCIDAVAREIPRGRRDTTARLLGHYYYAWVGANSSARLSLPGAEAAARVYLREFRALQRELGVDDKTLCKAVEGDCGQRVGVIEKMERERGR